MPNTYKITVINKTGGPQDYAFFNAPPIISGGASGAVWSNVMNTARNTPNDGQASFEVSLTYYATCGSFEGSLDQGSRVEVSKSVPIQLGSSNGGNITMGSSISLTVYDRSACDLGPPTNPGQGKLGNFQLDTACKPENAFTMQDAKDHNLLVGIATSGSGGVPRTMASFAPYPNTKYQIMPQVIFHVGSGARFKVGDIVKAEMMGNTMAVDFNTRGTNDVTLLHANDMFFYFQ